MNPEDRMREARRRRIHKAARQDLILKILDQCRHRSGEIGYCHLDKDDYLSEDYRAIIFCVHKGLLLWSDHFPGNRHLVGDTVVITPEKSLFRVTPAGEQYLAEHKSGEENRAPQTHI